MYKIKLSTAVDKYDGWIIKCSDGRFCAQNANDMGLCFGYHEELEQEVVIVDKIIKAKAPEQEISIVLCHYNFDFVPYGDKDNIDDYSYETLDEAIKDIINCYTFD